MKPQFNTQIRNSKMLLGEIYFWTSTIKDWKHLLKQDKYKLLIINCLKKLVDKKLINVYAFVIMPNHVHFVWEMLAKNKKEMPYSSFNKEIGHLIILDLKSNHPNVLPYFKVDETEREFRVWQRNPLAILMDNKAKTNQKIDYIHTNPLQERWNLADIPENYYWSSAKFYEKGVDDFGFLTHFMDRF